MLKTAVLFENIFEKPKNFMAKSSARLLWANRLKGKNKKNFRLDASSLSLKNKNTFKGIVLGIDPSLRGTGLSVLSCQKGNDCLLLDSKIIKVSPKIAAIDCLATTGNELNRLLEHYPIDHVAIEETIYVQNFQTAQTLGMVRGALITIAAMRGLPIFQYPPLRIKQAVAGFGRASKEQLAKTVQGILKCETFKTTDEADAAGVALCHVFTFNNPLS